MGARLNIITAPGIFRAYGIDGFLADDMTAIYVDEQIAGGTTLHRYRFTLAHEIGHWYLHEALYSVAQYGSIEEFLQFRDQLPSKHLVSYEWQANQFAGLILVPPAGLADALTQAIEFARARGLDPVDLSDEAQRDYVAEWIGRRLEVSGDVIRRRGADDGHWNR